LDEIAAAKRLQKQERNEALKQLLPSFVAASKEGQVTAYMSRACLVWCLRFPEPAEEEAFVHENFKEDPAYEEYIREARRKVSSNFTHLWLCAPADVFQSGCAGSSLG